MYKLKKIFNAAEIERELNTYVENIPVQYEKLLMYCYFLWPNNE